MIYSLICFQWRWIWLLRPVYMDTLGRPVEPLVSVVKHTETEKSNAFYTSWAWKIIDEYLHRAVDGIFLHVWCSEPEPEAISSCLVLISSIAAYFKWEGVWVLCTLHVLLIVKVVKVLQRLSGDSSLPYLLTKDKCYHKRPSFKFIVSGQWQKFSCECHKWYINNILPELFKYKQSN